MEVIAVDSGAKKVAKRSDSSGGDNMGNTGWRGDKVLVVK